MASLNLPYLQLGRVSSLLRKKMAALGHALITGGLTALP